MRHSLRPSLLAPLLAPFLALLFAGCSGGGFSEEDELAIDAFSTKHATLAGAPFDVGGPWLAYLADEATSGNGKDLNGDGVSDDLVAFAVDLRDRTTHAIGVAAFDLEVVQERVYLAVDESADGTDWDLDGLADDLVLLVWSTSKGVDFVDQLRLDPTGPTFRQVGPLLYYATADEPAGGDETTLRYVDPDAPTSPQMVANVAGAGALRPTLLGAREELLFLRLDETVEGMDLNGDTDPDDRAVLALFDGTDPTASLKSTGLALDPDQPVFGVRRRNPQQETGGDWRVGFLVSEADQGATSLNDPMLFDPDATPAQCAADVDDDDDVLHHLDFVSWFDGAAQPINTGIAGRDRVVVVTGFLATLSSEQDASCDLNADGDLDDIVVRWVSKDVPVLPVVDPAALPAVAAVPGGSAGLARLSERFVIAADEDADSQDFDKDGAFSSVLLGWLDPMVDDRFVFRHRDPDGFTTYVGVEWMAAEPRDGRLAASFQESIVSSSLNSACGFAPSDDDQNDALPVWPRFSSEVDELIVPGVGLALDPGRAGIVPFGNFAFFRVSEMQDGVDHNGDGDLGDVVLAASPLFTCDPVIIGTAADVDGPAIETGGPTGAAFLADESMAREDFNGDGDKADLVVRYLLF